jgi:transcriptional regulator
VYVADHFALPGDQARELLAHVGAADLVTVHASGPVATYLPFVFDPYVGEHGALLTHVARNNSQAREATLGEALVIAHGADHYISPEWQPSQAETGMVVPTWNYLTVHAYGALVVHDDPAWTRDVVSRTTALHERDYSVDQLSDDFVARMLRAIIGIEIRLTRVEAKAKMSQNKSPADVLGIIEGLRADPADEAAVDTAAWMERHSLPAAQRRAAAIQELASGPGGRRGGPAASDG